MSLRRIGKLFAVYNSSQILTILTQLLLPPAFLHAYGVSLYGQWLTLSAAISYLGTLNYGLQTYTNTQVTIHFNRGELQEAREVQSAGLRILLSALLFISVVLLAIFFVPLNSWLRLTIPQQEAQWTLYILGCQVMANMISGFFVNSYMVIGLLHRSQSFSNLKDLLVMFLQVGLVLKRAPFPVIAGVQLVLTLLISVFLIVDFSRRAPDIRPSLRYWKKGSLVAMLKPCAHYGLLYSAMVMAFQVPTILIQRLLGPEAVVVFSVTRTIYSMSRRLLVLLTSSLGQEITIMFGQQDWRKLHKLYEFSERIILLMIMPITFGVMLATPLLLQVWLHKGYLYQPAFCLLLGLAVSIQGIKDHKYQFQFSSNQVRDISYMAVVAYGIQLLAAVPMMIWLGLNGYMLTWLIAEIVQMLYLLHLNVKLFGEQAKVDRTPVYQLFVMLAVGALLFLWPVYHITDFSYVTQGSLAVLAAVITLAFSYWIFRVDEVRSLLWQKVSGRFPIFAARRQ